MWPRRRGDPPRLGQRGKRKLTESAKEFPKVFRLATLAPQPFTARPTEYSNQLFGKAGERSLCQTCFCFQHSALLRAIGYQPYALQQDAQKVHPARPQAEQEPEAYPPGRTVQRIRSTKSVRAAEW